MIAVNATRRFIPRSVWIGALVLVIIACFWLGIRFVGGKKTIPDPRLQAMLEPAFKSQDILSPFALSRLESFRSKGWLIEFNPSEPTKRNHGRKEVLLLPLAVAGHQAAKLSPDLDFVEIRTVNEDENPVRARAHLNDVGAFVQNQNLKAFSDSVEFEVTDWKPGARGNSDRAVEYLERGRLFANQKGRFKDALPLFEQGLALDGENFDILYAIGITHWALNDNARAIEYFERARQVKPGEYRIYPALARCYLQVRRREDAVDALASFNSERSKAEPAPDDRFYAPALHQAVLAHQELGDRTRARDLLKEYITRFPNDPAGYFLLGKLLFHAKDRKQAVNVLRRTMELQPADSATCYEIGWMLSELKDYNTAVGALRRSYTLGYRDVGLFTALSHCYAQLGRFFDAKHAAIEGMKFRMGDRQLEANFKAIHRAIVSRRLKPKGPPTPIELTEG